MLLLRKSMPSPAGPPAKSPPPREARGQSISIIIIVSTPFINFGGIMGPVCRAMCEHVVVVGLWSSHVHRGSPGGSPKDPDPGSNGRRNRRRRLGEDGVYQQRRNNSGHSTK
ncbi:uncharacterized protein TRIVIDRAFT_220430 [Trichoderma virens Gv29-8]|uniref:Uncharacterized protein n=1 Tax=Hypocrea virens (strain Gv29-8 / FGSC 10586) TaxID=413071 RepID=G9MLA4_HYPVG|nr:uncharacterized protein TRIVIDRAFT_220430 [Trichoderma virens Gv29-8]EHK24995.1 hypothetical protein TRIVIDRAFT_220430 [Trichoderma virens Gv29-8]UKZ55262.1 hypothetical protein TrVGV298_009082 [Trichoderma virens]